MNCHIVTDNPHYIDLFVAKAEEISPRNNQYYLLKEGNILNIKDKRVIQVKSSELIVKIRKGSFKKIVIHFLDNYAIELINSIPTTIEIYWMFWGADGYKLKELYNWSLTTKTKSLLNKPYRIKTFVKDIYRIVFNINKELVQRKIALSRINYCCTLFVSEVERLNALNANINLKHFLFAYEGFPKESDLTPKKGEHQLQEKGKVILLGNSANPSNNHVDALVALQSYKDEIEKIYCPLSYSGSEEYINKIKKIGTEFFGEKFNPIMNFIPKNKYTQILKEVDIAVFYHKRQQAFSNIINLLYLNKKILFHPDNVIYNFLKGYKIRSIFSDPNQIFDNLQIQNNLSELASTLSEERIENMYKKLLC